MAELTAVLQHPVTLLFIGLFLHLVKKVVEIRQSGQEIGLVGYVKKRPYLTISALGGALAAYGLMPAEQINSLTAFGLGYMANSAVDAIGRAPIKST